MTFVPRPLRPRAMLHFIGISAWITGCYMTLQIWYGHWCMTLVPGPSYWEWNFNSWRVGASQREPEGRSARSVAHVRVPPGQVPYASSACRTGQQRANGKHLLFPHFS
jgi:hypothetical protein